MRIPVYQMTAAEPRGAPLRQIHRPAVALAAVAAALVLVTGPLPGGAPARAAAAPQIVAGEVTQGSTGDLTGMCLDDKQGSTADGNTIDLYACNDAWASQLWTVEADGTIRDQGMCLDAPATTNETDVLLDTCASGDAGQQWQAQSGTLYNPSSGLCLGESGSAQGDSLWIFTCDGANSQNWNLPADSPATEAASAANGLQLMYNENTGLFDNNCADPSNPCCSNNKGNCWWWSANELYAITDYFEQQGTVSFPGAGAYLNDISNTYAKQSTFLNGAYDDEAWWALAWLNAYKLTGYTNYLQLAESLFYDINQNGWDGTCNGGVWQNHLSAHQKDAIVNELYIELAAGLYRATGDQGYLDGSGTTPSGQQFNQSGDYNSGAEGAWDWLMNSGMVETVSTSPTTLKLVADHLVTGSPCTPQGGQFWSYNQGVILGAAADLYKITGDAATYITPAEEIANGVMADVQLAPGSDQGEYTTPPLIDLNGILSEPCLPTTTPGDWPDDCDVTGANGGHNYWLQYKGLFIRNLYCLSRLDTTGDGEAAVYTKFIAEQANSVFANDQNTSTANVGAQDLNQFGFLWDSFKTNMLNMATQGSALEALNANMDNSYLMCR
jgi:predicted alpha-1,6-mannanase (GH76 family)